MKIVIIVMIILSVLVNLVGCGLKPATELPAEPEEPAIRLPIEESSEEPDEEPPPQAEPQSAGESPAAPRYVLTLSVTAGGENEDAALTGTAEIAFTNTSAEAWEKLCLRDYMAANLEEANHMMDPPAYTPGSIRAVRDGRGFATESDLEESIEVVIAGYQKKNAILTDHEKWVVSYHEIGHALVAARQNHSAPVQKITIIPRTSGALGYTMQVEEGNHYLMTKEEMENKIATLTGGRAAEEVKFGSITTGASNDIEQATKLARAMLTRYGMSEDFDMVALETVTNQYLGGDTSLACSAETQARIDAKVVDLVRREHQKALDILKTDRDKLDELAKFLYEKETITGEEFMEILNR